jgi:2-phospho-L-lactate transferase/gluconeogenesis factor (CofD/UPF0052 family)
MNVRGRTQPGLAALELIDGRRVATFSIRVVTELVDDDWSVGRLRFHAEHCVQFQLTGGF